jgi:hypothetical protein
MKRMELENKEISGDEESDMDDDDDEDAKPATNGQEEK